MPLPARVSPRCFLNNRPMTERKHTRPVRRKAAKRRLRKDRLALVLSVPVAIIMLVVILISRSCGDDGVVRPGGDFPVTVPEAIEAARRDAAAVLAAPEGSMERQNALFEIHARVSRLKANGYNHAALQYENSVRAYLNKTTND